METKKIAYLAMGILVGGILVVGAGTYASGGKSIGIHGLGMKGEGRGGFERSGSGAEAAFAKLVTKSVVNTASGAEITLTATDSGALAKLQKIAEFTNNKKPLDQAKISLTSVKLDNGVKLTVNGTDAASIKKIQDMAANGNSIFPMGGGLGFGGGKVGMMKGPRGGFENSGSSQALEKSKFESLVTKTTVNTASGVETTLTTSDSGALVRLQGMADMMTKAPHPDAAKVTVTSVKIDNGIKLTINGTDADSIKKIQDQAANAKGLFPMGGGKKGFGGGRGEMMKGGQGGRGMMGGFGPNSTGSGIVK